MPAINKNETMIWFTNSEQAIMAKSVLQKVNPRIKTHVSYQNLMISKNMNKAEYKQFYKILNTGQTTPKEINKLKQDIVMTFSTEEEARDFVGVAVSLFYIRANYVGLNVFLSRRLTNNEEQLINRRLAINN